MLDSFGFGGMTPAVQFMMMPMYADLLRIQAIEFNDQIRKSAHSFTLIDNKLRIFPKPTESYKLYFNYFLKEDKETPEESCPKHVIDERKVEEAIERMYRSEQQDMFDDPDMNWSGLR